MTPVRTYNGQIWWPGLLGNLFDNVWIEKANVQKPAVNVLESKELYQVEVAAPGMSKDDFRVTLGANDELMISMEKKAESTDGKPEEKKYLRREFSYSKFAQSFILPDNVDKEHIGAAMTDGVLTISLPKLAPEEKTNRVIEIH